eukprot:1425451-Prymnesium_polylepis.1
MPDEQRRFTLEEVAAHKKKTDCWIVVDGKVFDMTSFLEEHPGGRRMPLKYAGKDATDTWMEIHGHKKEQIFKNYAHLIVGVIGVPDDQPAAPTDQPAAPKDQAPLKMHTVVDTALSASEAWQRVSD